MCVFMYASERLCMYVCACGHMRVRLCEDVRESMRMRVVNLYASVCV